MKQIEIQKDGTIIIDGKVKTPWLDTKGYKIVWWQGKNKKVHRLVGEAYIPNPLKMCCINHLNGDKGDNRVENLEWTSSRKNSEHARLNGFHEAKQIGIPNLTDDEVRYIRSECKTTLDCSRISKELGRNYKTIKNVWKGLSYKDVI
jgi:hypothetical protein